MTTYFCQCVPLSDGEIRCRSVLREPSEPEDSITGLVNVALHPLFEREDVYYQERILQME